MNDLRALVPVHYLIVFTYSIWLGGQAVGQAGNIEKFGKILHVISLQELPTSELLLYTRSAYSSTPSYRLSYIGK